MATFLDISVLGYFTSIFTFLLVFVILFGLLELFNVFGEGRKGIHAIIAFAVGLVFIFSAGVVRVIQTFIPWFMIVIFLIFFILFAVRMFGVSTSEITNAFHNNSVILTFILIFAVVIFFFSLAAGFGQQSLEKGQGNNTTTTTDYRLMNASSDPGSTATPSFSQNLYNTLYHPKILGVIMVMLIVIAAMLLLTVKED